MLFIELHLNELFCTDVINFGKEFLEKAISIPWFEMFFSIFISKLFNSLLRSFNLISIWFFSALNSFKELFSICSTSLISFSFSTDCANSFKSNSTSHDFPSEIFLIEKSLIKLLISSLFSMFSKILETD